jgi:hypothetical protein
MKIYIQRLLNRLGGRPVRSAHRSEQPFHCYIEARLRVLKPSDCGGIFKLMQTDKR